MDFAEYLSLYSVPFGSAAVLAVIVFFLYRIKRLKTLDQKLSLSYQLILLAVFGFLSCLDSLFALPFEFEQELIASVSVAALSPLFAGLIGGPIAGIGAGVLGGVFAYFTVSPFTRAAYVISVVLFGVIGSLLFYFLKKRPIRPVFGLLIAALAEILHLCFILLFSEPFAKAFDLVSILAAPMILTNAFGLFACLYFYRLLITERKLNENL